MKHRKELRRAVTALERMADPMYLDRHTDRPEPEKKHAPFGLTLRKTFYVSEKASAKAVEARRASPIMAFVGPNGGGKSACMVYDTLPSLAAGRTVLSTVALLDANTGQPHPAYVPFTNWDQLLDAHDCDILMDEMVGIAGARESQRLDPRVQNILVQLRRRNIVLRWSAPNWSRADKIVREVTQSVTECRGYYAAKVVVQAGEGAAALWAPKRLFRFQTFDTMDFEEWTAGKRDKLKPQINEWFYGPGSAVFASYDTLDAVTMVAGITDDGRCNLCGKKVRQEYCKGHDDAEIAEYEHELTHQALLDHSGASPLPELVPAVA